MKNIIIYVALRFLTVAIPMFIIIRKKLETTSGQTGMMNDLPLMIAFVAFFIWGLFMIYEIGRLFYLRNEKLALVNLLILILIIAVFIYAGSI